ncbi:MAG: hypothetical protein ACOYN4_09315 [Bacteroidales bacterium]
MKTTINIDNYEEIMFRLVEDDFDKRTRLDLLQQIEKEELFKFEWEAWQKTKFADPLENYSDESHDLTEKINLIAEPKISGRKRIIYYWAAAASIFLLIGALILLTADYTSKPKQELAATDKKFPKPAANIVPQARNQAAPIEVCEEKLFQNQKNENTIVPVADDSNTIVPVENTLAEIPLFLDSVPAKANELAKAPEKKSRYIITIETSDIRANNLNNNDLAQNKKVNLKKVFTNTKMLLRRKPNGEPDKIYIIGDGNSYLCINLNY